LKRINKEKSKKGIKFSKEGKKGCKTKSSLKKGSTGPIKLGGKERKDRVQ